MQCGLTLMHVCADYDIFFQSQKPNTGDVMSEAKTRAKSSHMHQTMTHHTKDLGP